MTNVRGGLGSGALVSDGRDCDRQESRQCPFQTEQNCVLKAEASDLFSSRPTGQSQTSLGLACPVPCGRRCPLWRRCRYIPAPASLFSEESVDMGVTFHNLHGRDPEPTGALATLTVGTESWPDPVPVVPECCPDTFLSPQPLIPGPLPPESVCTGGPWVRLCRACLPVIR